MSLTETQAWINDLSVYVYALDKDTPAKTWWSLPFYHPAIARQIRIDRQDDGGVYALAPFRLGMVDGEHRILAAWPCLAFTWRDHLDITTVLSWNPRDNTVTVLGDPEPQLVGPFTDPDQTTIFADPRSFFQEWARIRAAYFVARTTALAADWQAAPDERDILPGVLIAGDAAKVRWHLSALPASINIVGADPKTIERAIFKAAHIPRVRGNLRAVA